MSDHDNQGEITMNYSEMTDAELDRLSAIEFDLKDFLYGCGEHIGTLDHWNPTHPDSNQAERYLFPKLGDSLWIQLHHVRNKRGSVFIKEWQFKEEVEREGDWIVIVSKPFNGHDQINRTKVIACLEAWEKIND